MEALTDELAKITVKKYACSNCWGDLELTPDMREKDMYFVICQKCKDETKGYVTKYYVHRRRNESEFEARDVKRMLQKINVIPDLHPVPKTIHENLRQLGF